MILLSASGVAAESIDGGRQREPEGDAATVPGPTSARTQRAPMGPPRPRRGRREPRSMRDIVTRQAQNLLSPTV